MTFVTTKLVTYRGFYLGFIYQGSNYTALNRRCLTSNKFEGIGKDAIMV